MLVLSRFFKIVSVAVVSLCFAGYSWAASQDIVEVASSNKDFSTLVEAIKAANLVETLKGKGPYTVFAPTNEAFAKLPKGALESLLKDKQKLVAVLTYHVVPGKVMAADIQNGPVNTVEGQPVTLDKTDAGVKVNDAHVVKADVEASNGVIHVIDAVLLPPAK